MYSTLLLYVSPQHPSPINLFSSHIPQTLFIYLIPPSYSSQALYSMNPNYSLPPLISLNQMITSLIHYSSQITSPLTTRNNLKQAQYNLLVSHNTVF